MRPNPLLKKLGFSDSDRLVIFHADDIGMCQATLTAYADLIDFGLISSAATMTPCPWFQGAAAFCRQHPEVDMGVHLTLNAEWDTYRWAPLSTRDPASGLVDKEGYFHHWTEETHANADPTAVQIELVAQLERAQAAGIDVTHIDTHMGTVAYPSYLPGYIQLAMQHCLPTMIPRLDEAGYLAMGMDAEMAAFAVQLGDQLEEQGFPLIDNIYMMSLEDPAERIEQVKAAMSSIPAGITHFILHPTADTPEIRALAPDWRCRVADYEAFTNKELKEYIKNCGVQVIGYRQIREVMKGS